MAERTGSVSGSQSRRALLLGAGAVGASVVLTSCGADDGAPGRASTGADKAAPAAGAPTDLDANVLAKVSEVPVGGGKVFAERGVVVTQPSEGIFKGFSAFCTHQQCPLAGVDAGTINCTCHGSRFSIEDGTPKSGPATRPLALKAVQVDGEDILLA